MALLFPWATREYLLWEMSLAQVILYHNIGVEMKYPQPETEEKKVEDMSADEVIAKREELRKLYGNIDG